MQRVEGVVQHYAWGDQAFLPGLLGVEADGRPWAELWLGTHPNGPSRLDDGTPLVDVAGDLPYLLKVLAAAEPLSLQTHPSVQQAREGHARGVFGDPNPKPELLCALTPFEALCGVRPVDTTLLLLDEIDGSGTGRLRRVLAADGPRAALEGLYRGTIDASAVIAACRDSARPEAEWVRKLDAAYPSEPSVAATLLLNHVVLEPGECLRLDAGNLHAYLHGAGIELMGNSDNVVRGGLTRKPVDVELLLATVDTTPLAEPVLSGSDVYPLPGTGVGLRRLNAGAPHTATGHELAIDLNGATWYLAPGDTMYTGAVTYVVVTP
jgi:mannose-6-phosphate isomerase